MGNVVLGGNGIKELFYDQNFIPWKWYGTFNEILYYKTFSLLLFSTTN